jgi:hypothetical protein
MVAPYRPYSQNHSNSKSKTKKTATGIKTHTIWIISRRRCSLSSGSSFILRTLDLDQRSGFRGADRGCDARDEASIHTLSRPRCPPKRRLDLRSPRVMSLLAAASIFDSLTFMPFADVSDRRVLKWVDK